MTITKQDMLNRVWQYFIVEKTPRSRDANYMFGQCYYRHPSGDGRRCAIGLFIADEYYLPEINLMDVTSMAVRRVLHASGVSFHETPVSFLKALQRVHDTPPQGHEQRYVDEELLRTFANEYSLEVPSEIPS